MTLEEAKDLCSVFFFGVTGIDGGDGDKEQLVCDKYFPWINYGRDLDTWERQEMKDWIPLLEEMVQALKNQENN